MNRELRAIILSFILLLDHPILVSLVFLIINNEHLSLRTINTVLVKSFIHFSLREPVFHLQFCLFFLVTFFYDWLVPAVIKPLVSLFDGQPTFFFPENVNGIFEHKSGSPSFSDNLVNNQSKFERFQKSSYCLLASKSSALILFIRILKL